MFLPLAVVDLGLIPGLLEARFYRVKKGCRVSRFFVDVDTAL